MSLKTSAIAQAAKKAVVLSEVTLHLQSTVLVASDLVVAVAVAIEGSEHDAEGPSPLAEEDKEMVPQGLLREEKPPVVDCKNAGERKNDEIKRKSWEGGVLDTSENISS